MCTVLRSIGHKAGVKQYGGDRDWVIVVCDGIPYTLCHRIQYAAHLCPKCDTTLLGHEECAKHNNTSHPNENIQFVQEFDWAILQPGSGHIEMNMVKGIVELGWDVFWKDLAICMNFRSETALLFCKKVSDHHKGWTLCRIAREAITKELILPYVRQELGKDDSPLKSGKVSVAEFLKFVMNATDPNYSFLADFTFEFLDAIFAYRAGVRCGIPKLRAAGRAKFAKVWCGRVHPIYRELEAADTIAHFRMPEQIVDTVSQSASITISGDPVKGEGADFRLEEINKQVQHWLPNIPSTADWKIACCNFDKLSTLRTTVFEQMGVSDAKRRSGALPQDITKEVAAFRTVLRAANYLSDPNTPKEHVSLGRKPLDKDLVRFCEQSRQKRALYIDAYLAHENIAGMSKPRAPAFREVPVFINAEEREKYTAIENKPISEIKLLVESNIASVHDEITREALYETWREISRGKKSVLLDFFYELQEYVCQDESDVHSENELERQDED